MVARGMDFELELSHANDYYREHAQAHVWKMRTKTVFSRKRGIPSMIYTECTPADYWGYLIPSGQAILLEAKSTESDTLNVTCCGQYRTFRTHQLIALRDASESNALAGLLIRFGLTDPKCYALNWKMLSDLLNLGRFRELERVEFVDSVGKIHAKDLPEKCEVPPLRMGGWNYLQTLLDTTWLSVMKEA